MKRLFFLFFSLIVASVCSAQTQHGYVKTRGRLDAAGKLIPGKRLSGVAIGIKGRNTVQSGNDGTFSFKILEDTYYLTNVRKDGYQLCDHDFISKGYHVSKDPLVVVMETPDNTVADRRAAENSIQRIVRKQIRAKEDEIEALREQQKITEEQYRQQFQKLRDERDKSERLVSEMAEWYSNIDYDQLDAFNLRIKELILKGELMKADSVINLKGDIHSRAATWKLHKEANAKLEETLSKSKECAQKELEELAQDCYNKHDIFKISLRHDSAAHYIELRAEFDSTNAQWQSDAGEFMCLYMANYNRALYYYQLAVKSNIEKYGENNPNVALDYNNIGYCYNELGDLTISLEYYQKALKIQKELFGDKHPDVATSYSNIGVYYYSQCDYTKALEYYQKALKIQLDILGTNHLEVATTYNNIAMYYCSQGNFIKGLEYLQKTLEIRLKLLGENHPDIAVCYNNIGGLYSGQCDYTKAMEYYQKALRIQLELFGETHPDVARSYNNIGYLYKTQQDYPKAKDCVQKSLEIRLELLGNNHPDVALCYNSMGILCNVQKEYSKALEYYQNALEIELNSYGEYHSDVAISYTNIGFNYYTQGDYTKALEFCLKAQEIQSGICGENHPDVAKCYDNTGHIYASLGDYVSALEYYQKAKEIYSQTLGKEHAVTLRMQKK